MVSELSDMKLIITIVERGKAEKIVDSAKKAGAPGATIMYGRGTGESEVLKFLKVSIEASKEIILVLAQEDKLKEIVSAMVETGKLKEPGTGILFTLPIDHLIGFNHRQYFNDIL